MKKILTLIAFIPSFLNAATPNVGDVGGGRMIKIDSYDKSYQSTKGDVGN